MRSTLGDPEELPDLPALWRRLRPQLRPALLLPAERLGAALGCELWLACETLQHTGSFKYRAALSAALHSAAPRLYTASSGNFGAALAAAARRCGRGCTVVMPARSAAVKIAAVRGHGATVDLIDTQVVSRAERLAALLQADPEAEGVSPYDDLRVIAGNSSLGAEIFAGLLAERSPPPDVLVAPVGGGGLAAGLVQARNLLQPGCQVVGAEPLLANDAARSLRSGVLQRNPGEPDTLCDGARTVSLGQQNFAVLSDRQRGLADIVEVEEAQVRAALWRLFADANLKAEPTGALALGALLQDPGRFAGRRVVCVVSGGNVDPALYSRLLAEEARRGAPSGGAASAPAGSG